MCKRIYLRDCLHWMRWVAKSLEVVQLKPSVVRRWDEVPLPAAMNCSFRSGKQSCFLSTRRREVVCVCWGGDPGRLRSIQWPHSAQVKSTTVPFSPWWLILGATTVCVGCTVQVGRVDGKLNSFTNSPRFKTVHMASRQESALHLEQLLNPLSDAGC